MNDTTRQTATLVLGGTGRSGGRVVERLTARGLPVRIGSRSGDPRFDWEDRSTWNPVLEGVGSAFWTRGPAGPLDVAGSTQLTTAPPGRKEATMASSTTTRKPADGDDRTADIVLGAAVIAMGLLAGLFYAFDIAVMPALTAADDRTLVDAMQQMIDKIENPGFYLTLLGAPALATVALVQARHSGSAKTAGWIVAGLVLYTVMLVVTFAFHFPLNDELKNAGDPSRVENLAAVRDDFVTPWVAWNIVRTLASTAAFGCLAWALVLRGRMG